LVPFASSAKRLTSIINYIQPSYISRIIKNHRFDTETVIELEALTMDFESLLNNNRGKFQDRVQEILKQILEIANSKIAQYRSSYGACSALLDADGEG
jgi:hypothetical protein